MKFFVVVAFAACLLAVQCQDGEGCAEVCGKKKYINGMKTNMNIKIQCSNCEVFILENITSLKLLVLSLTVRVKK